MAHEDLIIKAIEKFEEKFEKKLDVLDFRLDSVDKTLVKQEANIGEHMRRTELAEKSISDIQQDIKPIKRHVAMIEGALKAIGLLATVLAIGASIAEIVHIFIPLLHR